MVKVERGFDGISFSTISLFRNGKGLLCRLSSLLLLVGEAGVDVIFVGIKVDGIVRLSPISKTRVVKQSEIKAFLRRMIQLLL